jgi:hypothetical protein
VRLAGVRGHTRGSGQAVELGCRNPCLCRSQLQSASNLSCIGLYFAYEVLVRARGLAWWASDWLVDLISYGISAVIFTSVIRLVVLAESPSWLPSSRLVANYFATAAVLVVVSIVVDFITGSWLSVNFYTAFLMETPYDDRRFMLWNAAYSTAGFFLSAILVALIYPVLGMAASQVRIDLPRILRWVRKFFWRFLYIVLLLMSTCLVLRRAYWWRSIPWLPG